LSRRAVAAIRNSAQPEEFSMFNRLSPPSAPVFIISFVLAVLALVSLYFRIPSIGHFVSHYRFWMMTVAYAVLFMGVVLSGL
jgi:hypothetical protein